MSRAKELGYLPRSAIGSVAKIRVTVRPNDSPASILIPKGTKFRGIIQGYKYNYHTVDDYTITPEDSIYSKDIFISEGDYITQTYTVPNSETSIIIRIQNPNVDLSTLSVRVKLDTNATQYKEWTKAPSLVRVSPTSETYFIQENMDGYYEIQFGNNVLGKRPDYGNIVELIYLATNGPYANDIMSFEQVSSISGYSNFTIKCLQRSGGGQKRETIESIRFNAPRYYDMQNRAVTSNDYKQHILNSFSDIEALAVWGRRRKQSTYVWKGIYFIKACKWICSYRQ